MPVGYAHSVPARGQLTVIAVMEQLPCPRALPTTPGGEPAGALGEEVCRGARPRRPYCGALRPGRPPRSFIQGGFRVGSLRTPGKAPFKGKLSSS